MISVIWSRDQFGERACKGIELFWTQWICDIIITSLWRQNDVATSFWRNGDGFTSYVLWENICTGICIAHHCSALKRLMLMTWRWTGHDISLLEITQDVLPPNLVKSRSREIICHNDRIAMKFDRHLGNVAVNVPCKIQSDWKSLKLNLATLRLHKILR